MSSNKEKKKKINDSNDELENHLNNMLSSGNPEDEKGDDLPSLESIISPFDYDVNKNKSVVKAKSVLNSMLKFYLSEEFIDENQYILEKARLDEMGLSGIINQITLNERAIEIMMKTIDTGVLEPRMFEVFSMVQKTHIELVKMQATFLMNSEETFKKLRNDYDFYSDNKRKTVVKKKDDIEDADVVDEVEKQTYKGTRDLMKELELDAEKEFKNPNDDIIDESFKKIDAIDFSDDKKDDLDGEDPDENNDIKEDD